MPNYRGRVGLRVETQPAPAQRAALQPAPVADLPHRALQPVAPRVAARSGLAECCVPSGCPRLKEDIVHEDDPGDAVRVYCNNEACKESRWMHTDCFTLWQEHVLAYLRSCGRARSWSEKQRLQNLWSKKGYDLAYKACDCKCARGHLRKDLDYVQPPRKDDKKAKRPKKKAMEMKAALAPAVYPQSAPRNSHLHVQVANGPSTSNGNANHPQLRVRTSSFSSTGSSPPSSAGTPPLTPGKKTKFDFFADATQAASGNIFRRRTDLSVFSVLPRHQQNPYHIKMEDEGPHGNDETRSFVLTNLSTHQVTNVRCVVCQCEMPVFDKYPLIDGTFFLSPQRYNADLQVLFDHKMAYLNSICMKCLEGTKSDLRCRACKGRWHGRTLIIGTMYSYDIFAATPCCGARLSCKNCRRSIMDPSCAFQFFSEYSKAIQCPHCRAEDFHFIKPLEEYFTLKRPIRLL